MNIGVAPAIDPSSMRPTTYVGAPDIRGVMIGDGGRRKWAEKSVAQLGVHDRFVFSGRRPPEVMPNYFPLADVLILMLQRDPVFAMTIPAKLQSYLACGRPISAALDGEDGRVVRASGAGLASESENFRGLADEVLALLRMSATEREATGEALLRFYEPHHFDRERLLDEVTSHLAVVIAGRNRSRRPR